MSRITIAPRMLFAALLTFVMIAFSAADTAFAQRGQWERLATKKVNMLADRDVIELDRTDGRFNALRLNAVRGNINIYRIRVTFGNGEKQDLDISKRLREGEDTGAIDLSGKARVIDKIEMLYASSNLLKRAQLEVYGRVRPGSKKERADRIDDDRGDDRGDDRDERPNRVNLADWKKLGQRYVDLDFDRDRIWVGVDEGRFDRILLRAKGGDIRLVDLKVVYGNGEVDDISVRTVLRDGTMTKALDLKGRHRGIRRVEMVYRRGSLRLRPVLIEVFGRPRQKRPALPSDDNDFTTTGEDANWEVLGSRDVDLSLDRDEITISRGDGPFDAIALRARGNVVRVYDVRVTFGNGKRQTIRVDERLRPGRQSKALDLKGRARRITKVEMLYEKARKRGRRATMEVLARRVERRASTDTDTTTPDVAELPRGWSRVGAAVINRRSRDAVMDTRESRDRYRQIMLRVTGGAIRVRTAEITFRSGRKTRLRVNGTFRDGDKTDPIELKGRGRRIERIELDFEPVRGRRDVTVEVIGKP